MCKGPQAVVATESAIPGVKLPRTPMVRSQRFLPATTQASTKSQQHRQIHNHISKNDIRLFCSKLWHQTHTDQNNIPNKSIKELKNKLKHLKILGNNNQNFDSQITNTSKAIRSKRQSLKMSKRAEKKSDIATQLRQRFWWFCKKIFDNEKSKTTIRHRRMP
ncbi:hypothetical protein HELRODRAFT_179122 [Helobdella robusta]|uniref:Uncharacterized protein n=1 Tax=Helobdella robusta TaxID=6412 RepID=T1FE71_HELRO|nr:hypothetical protein HELRODRAFT_179122 [Helobdella robusta]ESN95652.1 hypothetical protein HELRODRAFT_179122 [Helobdella robusta]